MSSALPVLCALCVLDFFSGEEKRHMKEGTFLNPNCTLRLANCFKEWHMETKANSTAIWFSVSGLGLLA